MREIKIGEKIYTIKFSYKAAKYRKCVQQVFELLSGSVMMGSVADSNEPKFSDYLVGVSKQVSVIPSMCDTLMYAGLIATNPVSNEEEAGDLLIQYMEENGKTYSDMFEAFKECLIEDDFLKISGIDQMLETMNESVKKSTEEVQATPEDTTPSKKTTKKTSVK